MKRVFNVSNPMQVIGTRHGEKLYETLLTREERARSHDQGDYFRVVADNRDLNYAKFFSEGQERVSITDDYNSHNTARLDLPTMEALLRTLPFVQEELEK